MFWFRNRVNPVFHNPGVGIPIRRSVDEISWTRAESEIFERLGVGHFNGLFGRAKSDFVSLAFAEDQQRHREEHEQCGWNRFHVGIVVAEQIELQRCQVPRNRYPGEVIWSNPL